jgi:hypothetical protein
VAVPVHFKLVVRGVFLTTPETWSFSTKYSRDKAGLPDLGSDDVDGPQITTAVTTLLANSHFSSAVGVSDWRMYAIGPDGLMSNPEGPKMVTFAPGAIKGTGTVRFPPQIALCCTTVASNRGPARFGRFYLPGPADAIDTDLRYTDAQAAVYRTLATQFMKDVSNSIDMGLGSSSEGLNISDGPAGSSTGTRQSIDHMEVGRVLDTLRNRRKGLVEARNVGGHIDW